MYNPPSNIKIRHTYPPVEALVCYHGPHHPQSHPLFNKLTLPRKLPHTHTHTLHRHTLSLIHVRRKTIHSHTSDPPPYITLTPIPSLNHHGCCTRVLVQPRQHRRGHGGASPNANPGQIRGRTRKLILLLICCCPCNCPLRIQGVLRDAEAAAEAEPERVRGHCLFQKLT